MKTLIAIITLAALSGCGEKKRPSADIDAQRRQILEGAEFTGIMRGTGDNEWYGWKGKNWYSIYFGTNTNDIYSLGCRN